MSKKYSKTVITRSYVINGKEYTSLDDMPADVRKEYEAFENMVTEDTDNNGVSDIFERGLFKNSFFDRSRDFFDTSGGWIKHTDADRPEETTDPFTYEDADYEEVYEKPADQTSKTEYTSAVKKGGSGGKDLLIVILVLLVIGIFLYFKYG